MYAKMRTRLVMSNTFFGFDRAVHTPPNFVCTGPTMLPDIDGIYERLKASNGELAQWVSDAEAAG